MTKKVVVMTVVMTWKFVELNVCTKCHIELQEEIRAEGTIKEKLH